jgi:hypothetical protein
VVNPEQSVIITTASMSRPRGERHLVKKRGKREDSQISVIREFVIGESQMCRKPGVVSRNPIKGSRLEIISKSWKARQPIITL